MACLRYTESVYPTLNVFFIVPKKSESADIEEPKVENEGTIGEELNVHISPTPIERISPTSRISKVHYFLLLKHFSRLFARGLY